MTGWIKLEAAGETEIRDAQVSLLGDEERKGHVSGFYVKAEMEHVSAMDRLALMDALAGALKFDKEDWTILLMMKLGIGPLSSKQVTVDAPPWNKHSANEED